jgi:tetraacyldisaccharide 4'-kinase
MPSAPQFWERPAGLAALLLSPIAAAWNGVGRFRRAVIRPDRVPVPVVCVGNLVVGGSGKTPTVLALAALLAERGVRPHIVGRGYRGRMKGPVLADPSRHSVAAVGDEALLIAGRFPCWVATDRSAGVRAAAAAGAAAVLVDDGFQNPRIAKSLSVLVVDAGYGFGNGRVIPAGPLREDRDGGIARADAVILVHNSGEPRRGKLAEIRGGPPPIPATLAPLAGERFIGKRLFAFAGIGRPEKFFATLRGLGAELVEARAFGDHHRFRASEIAGLRGDARRHGCALVTTAKDIVRLPPGERAGIEVLEVEIRWPEPERLARLLDPVVAAVHGRADLAAGQ